jgi:hypothetical protein
MEVVEEQLVDSFKSEHDENIWGSVHLTNTENVH